MGFRSSRGVVRRTLIEGFYLANGQKPENSQVFIRESASRTANDSPRT